MYEGMTEEVILQSMLDRTADYLDKREGSIIYDALAPAAAEIQKMYFQLEHYFDLIFPDTAAAGYLDRFAKAYNMERKQAVKAVKLGTFNQKIPIGSRFSTVGETTLIYTAVELVQEEAERYIYKLECETPGKAGNHYFGQLLPAAYLDGLSLAELGHLEKEGADVETDEAFRERLLRKIRKPSTSGNVHDYYNWAVSCPGVGTAKVFPLSDGPGTVKLVITGEDRTEADETLLRSVAERIESVRPVGATVSVVSAVQKTINISARVRIAAGANLGNVQNAFEYKTGGFLQQNAFRSNYISLARIGNLLMDVDEVEDYDELKLNGKSENIAVAQEEAAVIGTVRLEVI